MEEHSRFDPATGTDTCTRRVIRADGVDYVAKFGPASQGTVGRFRVGGGMYIGPNAELGAAFRIGGGASFFNASRLGVGLDLVIEGGVYRGFWMGGLQLVASPEFHF